MQVRFSVKGRYSKQCLHGVVVAPLHLMTASHAYQQNNKKLKIKKKNLVAFDIQK